MKISQRDASMFISYFWLAGGYGYLVFHSKGSWRPFIYALIAGFCIARAHNLLDKMHREQ